MKIRRMTEADIPAVASLERQCFSMPWSPKGFRDSLQNALFLVALEDGLIGYAGMYLMPPEGEITNVAVAPEYRRRGVGRALLEEMKRCASENGISRIVLEVRAGNAGAIRLYEQEGFVRLGVRRNFYQLPAEDADIMEWRQQC